MMAIKISPSRPVAGGKPPSTGGSSSGSPNLQPEPTPEPAPSTGSGSSSSSTASSEASISSVKSTTSTQVDLGSAALETEAYTGNYRHVPHASPGLPSSITASPRVFPSSPIPGGVYDAVDWRTLRRRRFWPSPPPPRPRGVRRDRLWGGGEPPRILSLLGIPFYGRRRPAPPAPPPPFAGGFPWVRPLVMPPARPVMRGFNPLFGVSWWIPPWVEGRRVDVLPNGCPEDDPICW